MSSRRATQWRLRLASRDVLVVPRHELRAGDAGLVIPPLLLEGEYGRWLADPALRMLVREMLERFRGPAPAPRSPEDWRRARKMLARLFTDGLLVAVALPPASAGSPPIDVEELPPISLPDDTAPKKTWISIRLVDTEGKPIKNHRYRLTLPDGDVREGTTNEQGSAYFSDVDPGKCAFELPGTDGADWKRA